MTAPTALTAAAPRLAVSVADLGASYGEDPVLRGISFDLVPGELLAVLGPSGCGKTTLLRCLAGFERIDSGRIALADSVVALPRVHVPAHRRQVAVVPQDGALFPHLTVAENVGFGLPKRRPGRIARIRECLALVALDGHGERMPHELSGGQQQRVALARAMAPRPPLILLDEPFGALDAALRTGLRRDVRAALKEDGASAVLVTHDQAEALSVADRVAVMRAGRLRRLGTPDEVYARPADPWVAEFVGEATLLPLQRPGSTPEPGDAAQDAPAAPQHQDPTATPASPLPLHGLVRGETALGPVDVLADTLPAADALVVLRPEHVRIDPAGDTAEAGAVVGTVASVDFRGHESVAEVRCGEVLVRARVDGLVPPPGTHVRIRLLGPCAAVPA